MGMPGRYDIDRFTIQKNYVLTNLDTLIEAAIQAENPSQMQMALESDPHPLQHEDVTGVEIDAAKMAYDFGLVDEATARIFHEGPQNPKFMDAFRIMVKAGAPVINSAIQYQNTKQTGMSLPLAFDANGEVQHAWRSGVSAPRDYRKKTPTHDRNGRLVTRVVSSYNNRDEAWNRPYKEGLGILREVEGIPNARQSVRDFIRPGIFHRNSVNIQGRDMTVRYFNTVKEALRKNPDADPREVAYQALMSDSRFKRNSGLQHSDFAHGRYHEDNLQSTLKDHAREERMLAGRTGVHPELRDTPMINHFFNSNSHYRRGTNTKANRKLAEKYGVPEEEVREGIIELDQKAKQSSEKFGALFNEFLHDLARRGNEGKDPDWVDVEPTPQPLTTEPQEQPQEEPQTQEQPQPTQAQPGQRFSLDDIRGGGQQIASPPPEPTAPPPPRVPEAPPPPMNTAVTSARPAPSVPRRPPPVEAPPPPPQQQQPYIVSPLGKPVDQLPPMQRLAYILGQRGGLFGKADLVREALEEVQIDIAKAEVPPRFMGMGLNVNSLSDISMAANAVRTTPQDVVSILHSRGDWDSIAKSFNVHVSDVQKIKVMFNG